MPDVAVALEEGTSSNRYTILGRLAGGGMADIFLAKSKSLAGVERHVVLKRVIAGHEVGSQFAKMFLDEARLAAQLQHPNIAQVHDVGMLAGAYFFTMEYVHGKDVRALLQRLSADRRQLPLHHILHVAIGGLAALHHAHERVSSDGVPLGVVHRDVSPSNIMVSYEGTVKLLDFGVAKATQNSEETRSGTIKGKIGYLSPEQCRTGEVDRRSDIFSFGIVLHEMLTGRRLYRRDSDFNAMNAIVNEPVPPPSLYRADLPIELDGVLLRALNKEPDDRFSTAAEMLEVLEEVATRSKPGPSGLAMGRYMRELFGDRPEPWKDLPRAEVTPMTVTGQSVASLVPNASTGDRKVVEQLQRAPALRAESERETVFDLPPVQGIPALAPPLRATRRRWTAILAGAIGVVTIVAVWVATRDGAAAPASEPERAPQPSSAALALAAPVEKAAVVDAAIVVAARDPVQPATIATASARGDWIGTLQICIATAEPTTDEGVSCAIAACSAKQRSVAAEYYARVPVTSRAPIERACRVSGIVLRRTAPTTAAPQRDPCVSDPLACQK